MFNYFHRYPFMRSAIYTSGGEHPALSRKPKPKILHWFEIRFSRSVRPRNEIFSVCTRFRWGSDRNRLQVASRPFSILSKKLTFKDVRVFSIQWSKWGRILETPCRNFFFFSFSLLWTFLILKLCCVLWSFYEIENIIVYFVI